jgi:hypothetical protein
MCASFGSRDTHFVNIRCNLSFNTSIHVSTRAQSERDIVRCSIPALIQVTTELKTSNFWSCEVFSKKIPQGFGERESMSRENWLLEFTDEPIEFERWPVEVEVDFRKITNHLKGIYRIYLKYIKKNHKKHHKMSTRCNQLDLETLGSQPIMPRNLPGHWRELSCTSHSSNIKALKQCAALEVLGGM